MRVVYAILYKDEKVDILGPPVSGCRIITTVIRA